MLQASKQKRLSVLLHHFLQTKKTRGFALLCFAFFLVVCFVLFFVCGEGMSIFHDEVEIEDFDYDEETETYTYPCPCGDLFEITKVCMFVYMCVHMCVCGCTRMLLHISLPLSLSLFLSLSLSPCLKPPFWCKLAITLTHQHEIRPCHLSHN